MVLALQLTMRREWKTAWTTTINVAIAKPFTINIKLFLSLPAITMYKIIASLYRFNMRGANRSIPYFATLTNLLALFTLCFFIIIGLLNMQSVLKFWHTGSKGGDYLIGAVIVVPLYLLMFRMFPERKMKEQEALLTKKEYQLGLFSYVFLVIILMIALFVISK